MATITAAATGNWSATGTWVGGVLPGPGDVAEANGFTVSVDQSITCTRLTNTGGGSFNVTTSNCTITAELQSTSSNLLTRANGTPGLVINGDVIAGSAGAALNTTGGSTGLGITINGDLRGGTGSGVAFSCGNNSTGIVINGNVYAGSGTSSHGLSVLSGAAQVTVNGHAIGNNRGQVGGTDSDCRAITYVATWSTGWVKVQGVTCGPYGHWPVTGPVHVIGSDFVFKGRDPSDNEIVFDQVTSSQSGKLIGIGGGLIG